MNELTIVEHNNQRVLTTEQLAQAYGCEPRRISENFNRNQNRFVEGKHFYKLEGDALRDFKASLGDTQIANNLKFAPTVYLWTERGASRHSKMLGTDMAWEVFDQLEETYFTVHQKQLSPIELIAAQANALVEQERELARLRLDTEEIRKEQKIQSSRIDTLNGVCTEGTKRQKLVAMMNAYVAKNGLTHHEGWHRFKAAYNTAYHTSVSNSISYYVKENGLKKKPTVPEFLEIKGLLDDALRIADKLLNGEIAA